MASQRLLRGCQTAIGAFCFSTPTVFSCNTKCADRTEALLTRLASGDLSILQGYPSAPPASGNQHL